jgi:2-polyprenyl-3-methyl-5-hydroxy-6-metoxy-1,4-benzoquinol methylase
MGHDVTAIDIDPSLAELIRERARRLGVPIEVQTGDFATATELGRRFDVVLFVASFHHASDHLGLLRSIDQLVVEGGKLVFCAEPISDALPAPWCLRLDGESLWQIRRRGWLELGFQERYFVDTLDRFGWVTEKFVCADTPFGVVFAARRKT